MAANPQALQMSVEEYLSTTFRPDVDYVDGYIEERNMGEMDHGTLQGVLFSMFLAKRLEWRLWPALDTRTQVSARRFRVPDLSLVRMEDAAEQIIRSTPVLCIEVLSPEDTLKKMLVRIEDYFAMGVPHVWIINAQTREVRVCAADGTQAQLTGGILNLPGTKVEIDLAEVFGYLDEAKKYGLSR